MTRSRSKIIQMDLNVDVPVDLGDIELDDLVEELERRKAPHGHTKTDVEEATILDRYFQQRRRHATHGEISQEEREYWWHIHGREL